MNGLDNTEKQAVLRAAVTAFWESCGETPPVDAELTRATTIFAGALASGRRIPRQTDKTLQPLYGARRDLE